MKTFLLFIIIRQIDQSFKFESLSNSQEPVEVLLVYLDLPLVDVVQDELELSGGDSLQTEERVGVLGLPEDVTEVLTAGGEDDPVGGHLLEVLTDQGHVIEI